MVVSAANIMGYLSLSHNLHSSPRNPEGRLCRNFLFFKTYVIISVYIHTYVYILYMYIYIYVYLVYIYMYQYIYIYIYVYIIYIIHVPFKKIPNQPNQRPAISWIEACVRALDLVPALNSCLRPCRHLASTELAVSVGELTNGHLLELGKQKRGHRGTQKMMI